MRSEPYLTVSLTFKDRLSSGSRGRSDSVQLGNSAGYCLIKKFVTLKAPTDTKISASEQGTP